MAVIIAVVVIVVVYIVGGAAVSWYQGGQTNIAMREETNRHLHRAALQKDLEKKRNVEFRDLQYQEMGGSLLPTLAHRAKMEEAVVRCGNGHRFRLVDMRFVAGQTTRSTTTLHTQTTKSTATSQTNVRNLRGGLVDAVFPSAVLTGKQTTTNEVVVPTTTTETTTEYKMGCPTCHTSLYEFEDQAIRNFMKDYEEHDCCMFEGPFVNFDDPAGANVMFRIPIFLRKNSRCPYCDCDAKYSKLINQIDV